MSMFKNIVDFVEETIFMIGYNFLITLLLLLPKSFAVIAILAPVIPKYVEKQL